MKNLFLFVVLLSSILLISCGYSKSETSSDTFQQTIAYTVSEDKLTFDEQGQENDEPYLSAEINYPVIVGLESSTIQNDINYLLKYIPLCLVGDAFFESDMLEQFTLLPKDVDESKFRWSAAVEYEVLTSDNDYISVFYSGDCSDSNRIWTVKAYVTINISTGTLISLNNFYDSAQIKNSILDGLFEVIEGNYLPGGWDPNDPKTPILFAEAFEDELHKKETDVIFDRYSCQNFGYEADGVYIKFQYEDSLNGYLILRVQLEPSP